uniref:Odorant receptor n=1 Tax=Holotrichia parallela TaxID=93412 RepID=A0A2P9JY45_HOLPA|nr:odorant receptor 4 [Holotrichia parallela]
MVARPDQFDAYKFEKAILIFFGFPVGHEWKGLQLVKGIISIIISISLIISMIGNIIEKVDNVPLILETLYFGLTQTTFLCKAYNLIVNKHKVSLLETYLKKPIFNQYTVDQYNFIKKAVRICNMFAKTFRFFVGITIAFYAIFPFIEHTLPLPGWFPFDKRKYSYILYIYHLVCLILNGYNHTSLDCINAAMISIASAQFEILKDNLHNLRRDEDNDLTIDQQDAVVRTRVKNCVLHHNVIIKFVALIEDMYSNVLLIQFLCSIIIMCVTGFQVFVIPPARMHYITLVLYFCCNLTQTAIYSWFGHDILAKSSDIGLACYMTEWNVLSPKARKLISIIMERSKIPIILTAGKFINLSLNTFMMIVRTSYSYLAVLQHMYKT